MHILLATTRPETMRSFAQALCADPEVHLEHVAAAADILNRARASVPDLVVIDKSLPDGEPLDLARQLLMVNAMVTSAVVSGLSAEEFHAASEGLGLLGRIPEEPAGDDAVELLGKLRRILGRVG